MKKSLFILLASLSLSLTAQTYSPLVVDSAVWIIKGDDYLTTPWIDTYYGYFMNGDTTDGSQTYKKVYKLYFTNEAPSWSLPYQLDSIKLFAIVRESTKKIYAKQFYAMNSCPVNSEYLLFDFNYIVGDSANNLCIDYDILDTINNIGTNPTYLRKNFSTSNSHEFIEGIGSSFGLLETVFTNVSGGMNYTLYNYCQGFISDCNIITGFAQEVSEVSIEIFPNPTLDFINLKIPTNLIESRIEIFDIYGRKWQESILHSTKNVLNIELPKGIYFVRFIKNDQHFITKQIVIMN